MKLYDLRVNHIIEPFVDSDIELSWKLETDKTNVEQTHYRIEINDVYDTGKTESKKYSFVPVHIVVQCGKKYNVKVTVWNNYGEEAVGNTCFYGAVQEGDWKAKLVSSPFERIPAPYFTYGTVNEPVWFKRKFRINGEVLSATLFATCYGVYEAYMNGKRLGCGHMAPEFTPYDKILYYQCYDISEFLKEDNVFEMLVGDGWYFCPQTEVITKNRQKTVGISYEIHVKCKHGEEVFYSDGSEICRKSNIIFSDLFMGESVDMTATCGEEKEPLIGDMDTGIIACQPFEQITVVEEFEPKRIFTSPKGEVIIDFGQVVSGKVRMRLREKRGRIVTLEHSEVLDEAGNFFRASVARQTDSVICSGEEFVYEPKFTFHGFRYVLVGGVKEVRKEDFSALLLSTKKRDIGDFSCCDERMNRLYKNIRYSQKNNTASVPTDCPTREKAGWTGDIAIFIGTAYLNEDMTPFINSWLRGLRADQLENGVIPIVSPYTNMYDMVARKIMCAFHNNLPFNGANDISAGSFKNVSEIEVTPIAGWSDAIVFVPYEAYRATGNIDFLSRNYEAMRKHVNLMEKISAERRGTDNDEETEKYLFDTGFHFGEWLVPGKAGEGFEICKETALYISVFFAYETTRKLSEIAGILNYKDDETRYAVLAENMKRSIQKGILRKNALPEGYQGAYVLAFAFDLVPDDLKSEFKRKLTELIERNNNRLGTGFLATPYILPVLVKIGRSDLARKILWQTDLPSWLYEVEKGATTIWEDWAAIGEDGKPMKTSYDHYAFGVVDSFIFSEVCGIKRLCAGCDEFLIEPNENLGFSAFYRTYYCEAGLLKVQKKAGRLIVTVPPCSHATVIWHGKKSRVGSGKYIFGQTGEIS